MKEKIEQMMAAWAQGRDDATAKVAQGSRDERYFAGAHDAAAEILKVIDDCACNKHKSKKKNEKPSK